MQLRLHKFTPLTRVEGPGARACIQVQGCSIHCPGCAVPFTWNPNGGVTIDVDELASRVLQEKEIEGITFLGGEPFDQAQALAYLGGLLREEGLSVLTFTGYLLEDLQKAERKDWDALISVTDLLIDGPFKKQLLDTSRPWVGSSNQRYHFLTDRYRSLQPKLRNIPNRMEVRLLPDGRVFANGLTSKTDLDELFMTLLEEARD